MIGIAPLGVAGQWPVGKGGMLATIEDQFILPAGRQGRENG